MPDESEIVVHNPSSSKNRGGKFGVRIHRLNSLGERQLTGVQVLKERGFQPRRHYVLTTYGMAGSHAPSKLPRPQSVKAHPSHDNYGMP
jgi:hypothetical protein